MQTLPQSLSHDLRYALRQLVKSPGFTLTAVVSLALGIGATTAVFSVLYAALIHPYPFRDAGRIMRLTVVDNGGHDRWVNLNGSQIRQLRQSMELAWLTMRLPLSVPSTVALLPSDSTTFADRKTGPSVGVGRSNLIA